MRKLICIMMAIMLTAAYAGVAQAARANGSSKKPRVYDAAKDAAQTRKDAPNIDESPLDVAPKERVRTLESLTREQIERYGESAAALTLPETKIKKAGGELYYALLYTLLNKEADSARRGYIVIPAKFAGCSEAAMAQIRAWLRESFEGLVIGMAEDFYGEGAPFSEDDLGDLNGMALDIERVVPAGSNRFIADAMLRYSEKGAQWYRILLERTQDGWRIDFCGVTLMA